jgi:hypothetical protein
MGGYRRLEAAAWDIFRRAIIPSLRLFERGEKGDAAW